MHTVLLRLCACLALNFCCYSKVNANPEVCVSNDSKIQKWAIVENFSVETEELTPTLKLKRGFVEDKYSSVIEALYRS